MRSLPPYSFVTPHLPLSHLDSQQCVGTLTRCKILEITKMTHRELPLKFHWVRGWRVSCITLATIHHKISYCLWPYIFQHYRSRAWNGHIAIFSAGFRIKNGAAEKWTCATLRHHYRWKCTYTVVFMKVSHCQHAQNVHHSEIFGYWNEGVDLGVINNDNKYTPLSMGHWPYTRILLQLRRLIR